MNLRPFIESILTMHEDSKLVKPTYPLAVFLLQHFSHLFLEEIPFGLPLKRDIQHQIDLILGAILSINLPTE